MYLDWITGEKTFAMYMYPVPLLLPLISLIF